MWLLFFAVSAVLFQSCYSSTAVTGTPVNRINETNKEESVTKGRAAQESKEAIREMSKVRENETFAEISGVPEYKIGPLDVLEISSHIGEKVTNTTVTVDSLGKISFSFIDDLKAEGLTPSQLDELITEQLSGFIRKPRIAVLVKEFKSKSATVLGELSQLRSTSLNQSGSGRVYLEGKTTLMDLIAKSGGYTIDADIRNVKLLRRGKSYPVNLYDIIEKADNSQNIIIDNGDILDVPSLPEFGERVYVMGEVNSQGIYSLKDVRDLLGAISLAGSFTTLAKEANTLVVRGYGQDNKPLVMMSDLDALFTQADLSQNVQLQDGDLVYVPRMLIGDINDWITNTMPLLDFLFYPKRFQGNYFSRDYLHINPN